MSLARQHRPLLVGLGAVAAFSLAAGALSVPASAAPRRTPDHSTFSELTVLPGDDADASTTADDATDVPAMVSAPADRPLARPDDVSSTASDTTIARAHLEDIAPLWGIDNSTSSLRAVSSSRVLPDEPVVRFTQLVDGVPVYGGGLVVALDDSGGLRSVAGDVADDDVNLDFAVTAAKARQIARAAAASSLDLPAASLRVGTAFRYAYDPRLVDGTGTTVSPAWRVIAGSQALTGDKAEVLVDARTGRVLRNTGASPHVDRAVCDGANNWKGQAAYGWCGQNGRSAETGVHTVNYVRTNLTAASTGEVESAYSALTQTDTFYSTVLGYDLNAHIAPSSALIGRTPADGPTLSAIVQYCEPEENFRDNPDYPWWYGNSSWWAAQMCPMPNASWAAADYDWDPSGTATYPGGQMFIGGGLAAANDVIAHEMTHGVTAATSRLVYAGQSGAINESMSDVFGQLVEDYSNYSTGSPANSVDPGWAIGEAANAPRHGSSPYETRIVGAVRSMSNPGAYGQPATLSGKLWETGADDNGGVHTNSGPGNYTAYLIAHGGSGIARLDTTSPVGSLAATQKVAHLYWAVQQVLPSNASYRTLGAKLDEQCRALAASSQYGFTTADCTNSVDPAIKAAQLMGTSAAVSAASAVNYGKYVAISGKVAYLRGGGMGGVVISLQRKLNGTSTWATIATGTTSTSTATRGIKTWSVKPFKSASYRVVYAGAGLTTGSTSSARTVASKPLVGRTVKVTKVKVRKPIKVTGVVRPGMSGRTIFLQQYVNKKWRDVAHVKISKASKYSLSYRPTAKAKRLFRMHLPASTTYGDAVSANFTVTIV